MKRVLAHALRCCVLGVCVVSPVRAQETLVCSDTETPGTGRCPELRVLATASDPLKGVLAPTAHSTNRSVSLSGNSVSVLGTAPPDLLSDTVPGLVWVLGAYNFADLEPVGASQGNAVFVKDSSLVGGSVFGGYALGDATNNSVSIAHSHMAIEVYGGYAHDGNATHNSLSIAANSAVGGYNIFSGYSYNGDATHNSLSIADSHIGVDKSAMVSGHSYNGNASHNTLSLTNSRMSGYSPYVYASVSIGNTAHNSLSIVNSEISEDGASIFSGNSHFGDATHNSLSMSDSKIVGKRPTISSGASSFGNATHNSVKLSGTWALGEDALLSGGAQPAYPRALACEADKDCFTSNLLYLKNYVEPTHFETLKVGHFASYAFLLSAASEPLRAGTVSFVPKNGIPVGAASAVSAICLAPGYAPAVGTKIPLLCADTFEGAISNDGHTLTGSATTFQLSQEADCVYATVSEIGSDGGDLEAEDCGYGTADESDEGGLESQGHDTEAELSDKQSAELSNKQSAGCGCAASGNTSLAGLGGVLLLWLQVRSRRRRGS